MPIYEFYCAHCHRIFSFLSRTVTTTRVPACPRCAGSGLTRRPTVFAISKNRPEPAEGQEGMPPGFDETRLEQALASLEAEAGSVDEADPRQAARLMRRLFDATGLPVGTGMEEALRRMEAGEDPDKVDEDMGEALDEDPFAIGPDAQKPRGLRALRRRMLPPTVDPALHEM